MTTEGSAPKTHPEFIVEDILQTNALHLIAGPSGAGKSRWLLQMIKDWQQGKDILTHKSHPLPFGYLLCDRRAASLHDTLRSLEIKLENFPTFSLMDDLSTEPNLLNIIGKFPSTMRVLFIESLGILVEKINDYHSVWKFLRVANAAMRTHNLTLIASMHTAKAKEGQEYVHSRERILGSAAWAGCSDTIICVDPTFRKGVDDGRRTISIWPRNSAPESYLYQFNNQGLLVPSSEAETCYGLLDQQLQKLQPRQQFSTTDAVHWGDLNDLSRRTVEAWLRQRASDGIIERLNKGLYIKRLPA